MDKQVLFIGTSYMNIYLDIVDELLAQGYSVDFIEEVEHSEDPDNVRGHNYESPEAFEAKNAEYWENKLSLAQYSKCYDILFVLDGQSISPCVFDILRQRNEHLYAVNYLFDTVRGVYRFDKNFQYFNKVATFDILESNKFGIDLLPIFWPRLDCNTTNTYKLFGMGAFKHDRFKLFQELSKLAKENNLSYYFKLKVFPIKFFPFIYPFKMFFKRNRDFIKWKEFYSEFTTFSNVPLSEFKDMLCKSEIVVDTSAEHQDGLTSRFMWALGAGKKIITTNKSADQYDFYDPSQILVIDDLSRLDSKEIQSFVLSNYSQSQKAKELALGYRIDNWIRYLLNV